MVTVTLEFETVEQATAALQGIGKQSPILVGAVVADKPLNVATAATKPAAVAATKPAATKPAPVKAAPVVEAEEDEEEDEEEEEEEAEEEAPAAAAPGLKKLAAQLKDTVKLRDAIGFLMEKCGVKDLKSMRKIAADLKPLVPCMERIDPNTFDERVTNAYKFMESQAN